ncbi:MAG: hypothetical protein ACFUZC_10985 [Chthoniobacteraceae bacterium]
MFFPPPDFQYHIPAFCCVRHLASQAFSLVEVTVSLGIIAFVLTGITGLLSGSFSTARDSADDNALTLVTRDVVEDQRGRSMDDLSTATATTRYFLEDGSPCNATNDASALTQHALYRCVISCVSDDNTKSADGTINLVALNLRVSWPMIAAGSASERNTRNIYVKIARY